MFKSGLIFPVSIATPHLNMSCNISFRDVQYAPHMDSITITVITDVPCHCWLRLSTNPPDTHKVAAMKRGIQIMDDYYYCFTAYEDNEQIEPGDTLTHTWLKPDWPYCVTKYFYLWGTIAGEVCPSTSPTFSYHNQALAAKTFYATATEDFAYAPNTPGDWLTARGQADGRWVDYEMHGGWSVQYPLATRNYISFFTISRAWLWFDTTGLIPSWADHWSIVKMRIYIPTGSAFWPGQGPLPPLEDGHKVSRADTIITENKSATRPITKSPPG